MWSTTRRWPQDGASIGLSRKRKSNNPKMKKKTNRENLLEALTPLPLSLVAPFSLSLSSPQGVRPLPHLCRGRQGRLDPRGLQGELVAFFSSCASRWKKNRRFLSSSTLGRKNQPLSLLLSLAPRFPFPSTKNRPSTSRSRSCRRLPSSRSSTPSSASSSRRSSPPVSFSPFLSSSLFFLFRVESPPLSQTTPKTHPPLKPKKKPMKNP